MHRDIVLVLLGLLTALALTPDVVGTQGSPLGKGDDRLERALPEGVLTRLGTTRFRAGGMINRLGMSGNGQRLLAIMGGGEEVVVWNVATGQIVRRFPTQIILNEAELSHDGKRLFTNEDTGPRGLDLRGVGSSPSVLKIYDVDSGKVVKMIEGQKELGNFALAPNERTVALQFVAYSRKEADGTLLYKSHVELRDLASDRILHTFAETEISGLAEWLFFTSDSQSLVVVSSARDGSGRTSAVRQFDCKLGKLKARMEIDPQHYFVPPIWDGKSRLAIWTKVWDLADGKLRMVLAAPQPTGYGILRFMPDGKTVLVSIPPKRASFKGRFGTSSRETEPASLALWDLGANKEIRRLPKQWMAFIAPDGKSSFTATMSGAIRRFDLETGREITSSEAPTECADWLVFSPDKKHLAAADQGIVRVWDVATGKQIHQQPWEENRHIRLLDFTPDSKTLLLGGSTQVLALDTTSWKQTRHTLADLGIKADAADYAYCALLADGKTLTAYASNIRGEATPWQGTMLWDWRSGKRLGPQVNKPREPLAKLLPGWTSSDNKLNAQIDVKTGVLRFVDPISGKEVGQFRGLGHLPEVAVLSGFVKGLSFAFDNSLVAVSCLDTTILILDMRKIRGK